MDEQSELKANHAYEIFKLQWMINHGFTLGNLMQCLQKMRDEAHGKHMWEPVDSRGNCLECIRCGDYISYYGDPDENGLRKWDKVINGLCTGDDELPLLFRRWEHRVGFAGGQIWPCFEKYRDSEYASDPGKAHLLISVFERNIQTEVHPTLKAARAAMLAELKEEFMKDGTEAEWDELMVHNEFECDSFAFNRLTAWSNLDDDCNCDWQIVPLPPIIT